MPKMDLKRIVHSSLTEHRIIAYRGQPFPDAAFRPLSSHPPDLHYLNSVPGKKGSPPPPLTLFQAYGELARSHPAYGQRYLTLLDELAVSHPDHPLVLTAMARRIVAEKRPGADAQAIQYLTRAIDQGPAGEGDYRRLAELLARAGRAPEAIEVLKKGIAGAPYSRPTLYKVLTLQYMNARQYDEALATMREMVRLFPQDTFMRNLLRDAEDGSLYSP